MMPTAETSTPFQVFGKVYGGSLVRLSREIVNHGFHVRQRSRCTGSQAPTHQKSW